MALKTNRRRRPARVFPVEATPDGNVFPRDGNPLACPADILIMTIARLETLFLRLTSLARAFRESGERPSDSARGRRNRVLPWSAPQIGHRGADRSVRQRRRSAPSFGKVTLLGGLNDGPHDGAATRPIVRETKARSA
ncbi:MULTISPECIES: hypothetical protein [unclassified Streptosporangium]|uniref:hypothetical protein n=1 Tax=unclassified Streptosporangium TaxID=2632669 RepID=UPI002E289FF8|nr:MULTISPECIES: hypothetical protein [unclassified Streptosporangium]